jgi:branched-subunit amino acid aminotransferase/4-amino-4-deoxychorismate lyase
MSLPQVEKIWMDGSLVDWDDAQVHVLTHALHYGSGVFEGIRCYETADGPAVFRLTDHMRRMERSAKILRMPLGYTAEELVDATKDVIRANPDQVTQIRVRFKKQDGLPYEFDPSEGPGYVWHCHIIDHEDNEMMRPMLVKK